jgi:hypothetical protein
VGTSGCRYISMIADIGRQYEDAVLRLVPFHDVASGVKTGKAQYPFISVWSCEAVLLGVVLPSSRPAFLQRLECSIALRHSVSNPNCLLCIKARSTAKPSRSPVGA